MLGLSKKSEGRVQAAVQSLNRLRDHVLNRFGDGQANHIGFVGLGFFEGAELAVEQTRLHVVAHALAHALRNQIEVAIEKDKTHLARLFADALAVDLLECRTGDHASLWMILRQVLPDAVQPRPAVVFMLILML